MLLQSAWFRPHNRSEDFDNLYFAGAGTHPGAGLPGVLASGKIAADLIGGPAAALAGNDGAGKYHSGWKQRMGIADTERRMRNNEWGIADTERRMRNSE